MRPYEPLARLAAANHKLQAAGLPVPLSIAPLNSELRDVLVWCSDAVDAYVIEAKDLPETIGAVAQALAESPNGHRFWGGPSQNWPERKATSRMPWRNGK